MALRNGNAVGNLVLQRVGAAHLTGSTRRRTGVLQLLAHPVLRVRTVVLMYVW